MRKPPEHDTDACAEGSYGLGALAVVTILASFCYAGYVFIEWVSKL